MLDKIYNIVKVLFILSILLKTFNYKLSKDKKLNIERKELLSDYIALTIIILFDIIL